MNYLLIGSFETILSGEGISSKKVYYYLLNFLKININYNLKVIPQIGYRINYRKKFHRIV